MDNNNQPMINLATTRNHTQLQTKIRSCQAKMKEGKPEKTGVVESMMFWKKVVKEVPIE